MGSAALCLGLRPRRRCERVPESALMDEQREKEAYTYIYIYMRTGKGDKGGKGGICRGTQPSSEHERDGHGKRAWECVHVTTTDWPNPASGQPRIVISTLPISPSVRCCISLSTFPESYTSHQQQIHTMNIVESLFGRTKSPAERLRQHQRSLQKAQRELDRERTKLENQEKRLVGDIKKSAKQGQMVRVCDGTDTC